MALDIEFKFPDWAAKLKAHEEQLNRFQAAIVQTNRGMIFDKEGQHNGRPRWKHLQLRSGQILSNRGTLRKSIAPGNKRGLPGPGGTVSFVGDSITVGTQVMYAALMNYGTTKMPDGVLRPVRAKALRIPIPSGANATNDARELRAAKLLRSLEYAREALSRSHSRMTKAKATFAKGVGTKRDRSDPVKGNQLNNRFDRAQQAVNSAQYRVDALNRRISKIIATGKGGQGFIFRKFVRIPARDFISWNEQDQAEMDAAVLKKLVEVLNG